MVWLRDADMSLEDIKRYAELLMQGFGSANERKALLEKAFEKIQARMARMQEISWHLQKKIAMYDESIKRGVDLFNVQSSDYKDCNEAVKE